MTRRRPSIVSFHCPHCGAKLRAPTAATGARITCHRCHRRVTVPSSHRSDTIRGDQTQADD